MKNRKLINLFDLVLSYCFIFILLCEKLCSGSLLMLHVTADILWAAQQ